MAHGHRRPTIRKFLGVDPEGKNKVDLILMDIDWAEFGVIHQLAGSTYLYFFNTFFLTTKCWFQNIKTQLAMLSRHLYIFEKQPYLSA